MSTALSRWFARWMPISRRPLRRRPYTRPQFERLEARITPADFFAGGVRVATADITGDGVTDIITAAGPSGGPHIRVLNGATGAEVLSFMAYDMSFRGGVFVAAGDMDGDGTIDIVTGAGEGGSPHVKIFNGRTGALQREFQAFDPAFEGGVRVAVGDVTGDGRADIIAGAGPGGGPIVRTFSGQNLQQATEFTAFEGRFTRGIFVGAGDTNADGRTDIIVGSGGGKGSTPQVKVFSGNDNSVLRDFLAFDAGFTGGVSVAGVRRATGNGFDILTGAGAGGVPLVHQFDGSTGEKNRAFMAFQTGFTGGVWVSDAILEGRTDIVTGAGFGGGPHVMGWNGATAGVLANFFAFTPITGPFAGFAKDQDGDTPDTPDTTAPVVTITTTQPTAPVATNQTIQGTATDNLPGVTLTASVDGGTAQAVTLGANGAFTFTTGLPLTGQADGSHTVVFTARDAKGNTSTAQSFTFTLETTPETFTFDLAAENDGSVLGNHRTGDALVRLSGTAAAASTIVIVGTNFTTTADANGNYSFNQVPLELGVNSFTARATSPTNEVTSITRLIIRNSDPLAADPIENFSVAASAEATILNLPAIFSDIDVNSLVHFNTTSGEFDLELFDQQTPITAKNFLTYISSGRYANTVFHRSVANFVIQGGGFKYIGDPARLDTVTTDPTITNEPVLSNQAGTVSMAKLGGDPNSATSQFFFNLKDNSRVGAALDTQNGGFTAFGQLRGNGVQIVNQLAAIPVQNRGGVFSEIPLQNYPAPPAGNFPGDTTPANYAFVNSVTVLRDVDDRNGDALTFSVVSNSNPNLVSTDLVNGRLSLRYAAGQNGRSTITLRATDTEGRSVDSTFTISVGTVADDADPPVIALTTVSGETGKSNPAVVGKVSDDGGSGVLSLTVSVDGGAAIPVNFDAGTGDFTFTPSLAVNGSQDGPHTLTFLARDVSGNVSLPGTFTFTLDTTAPAVSLTSPASGQTTDTNITIIGQATDAISGLGQVAVSVDGAAAVNATLLENGGFSFTTNFAIGGADDGLHTISFSARDVAGNLSGPVPFTTTLVSPGALTIALDTVSDTFGGGIAGNHRTILDSVGLQGTSEPGATVTLIGTTFTTAATNQGTFSFSDVPLELGVNTFRVRATLGTEVREFTRRIVRDSEPTLAAPVANFTVAVGSGPTFFNLPAIFSDADVNTLVRFNTSAGSFDVELFDQFTPATVKNFLDYAPRYAGTIFHRNDPGVLLQGGQFRFDVDNGDGSLVPIDADAFLPNEAGLSNQSGTLVMAQASSSRFNQQNQFFFNLGDNSGGGQGFDTAVGGFSVFGTLRGNGAQVIADLTAIPVQDRGGDFSQLPLQNYPAPPAGEFPTDLSSTNLAIVNSVSVVRSVQPLNGDALTFSVGSNSNPNMVTPVITGGKLALNYSLGQTGTATIVIRATDAEGHFIEASFTVTVV